MIVVCLQSQSTIKPLLYEENLARVEGKLAYPLRGRANFSYISLQNLTNRFSGKNKKLARRLKD